MTKCSATDGLCLSSEMFLSMAIIIIAARFVGIIFRYFRQPAVLGEIIAGILLGNSALGQIPGNIPAILFPPEIRIFLNVCAQLGLIIFMFVVGLEVDINGLASSSFQAIFIGGMSVVLPFLIGAFVLSPYLYDKYKVCAVSGNTTATGDSCTPVTEAVAFNLFIGVAMSVTAFPVLARIITDFKMVRLPVGTLVMACAALNDLVAWILLAICLAVKQASNGYVGVIKMIFASVGYFIALTHVLNPILRLMIIRQFRLTGSVGPGSMAFVLINLLVTSWFLHYLGFHAMLGAFMFGLAFPRTPDSGIFHLLLEKLETVSVLLLLPCFFLVTGLSIDVSRLGNRGGLDLLYVIIVAVFGKVLGSGIPALMLRMPLQKCATIGVLMNTRGLAEIVILNIGLQQNILNQDLFTIMVVMAVVTTVMAGPLLLLVYPSKLLEKHLLELEETNLKRSDGESEDASILLAVIHDVTQAYDIVCAGLESLHAQNSLALENGGNVNGEKRKVSTCSKPVQVVLLHFAERPGEIGTGLQETTGEVEQRHVLEKCIATLEEEKRVAINGGMVMLRVKNHDRSNVQPKVKIICKALIPNLMVVDWPHDLNDQDILKQVVLSATCPVLLYTGKSSQAFTPDALPPPQRHSSAWTGRHEAAEAIPRIEEERTGGHVMVSSPCGGVSERIRAHITSLHTAIEEEFGGLSLACCLGRQPLPVDDMAATAEVKKEEENNKNKTGDARNRMDHLRNNADQLLNHAAMQALADESMKGGNVTIMVAGLDHLNQRNSSENSAAHVENVFRTLAAAQQHTKPTSWPSPRLDPTSSLRGTRSIRSFAPILISPPSLAADMVMTPVSTPKTDKPSASLELTEPVEVRQVVQEVHAFAPPGTSDERVRTTHMQVGPV